MSTNTLTAEQIIRTARTSLILDVDTTITTDEAADETTITIGDHRLAMGTEWEDDGETVWGWTWTTYVADADTVDGWEEMGTDASQDEVDTIAAVTAWITRQA
ncbi:MAG: hypothetical protein ACYC1Z_03600 [Georgenia sp.]